MKKRKIQCSSPMQKSFPKEKLRGKEMKVKELYICIWSANPNIQDRVPIDIFYKQEKNKQGIYNAQMLGVSIDQIAPKISLLFDKTAKDLEENSRNFLFMQKGSYIRIDSETYSNNHYLFNEKSGDRRRKYFEGMLESFTSQNNEQQSLISYIKQHFSNIKTFSFGIYLKASFYMEKDCYIFSNDLGIPIWSILVLGDITNVIKKRRAIVDVDLLKRLPPKAIVETPIVYDSNEETCTAEDLGRMRRSILTFIKDTHRDNESSALKIIDNFMTELAGLKDEMGR